MYLEVYCLKTKIDSFRMKMFLFYIISIDAEFIYFSYCEKQRVKCNLAKNHFH